MNRSRTILIALLCSGLLAGAVYSIYRTQFARPPFNVELHRAVGRKMAEETARVLTNAGKIVLISLDSGTVPELDAQLDEFQRALAQHSRIKIKEHYRLDKEEKGKYSFGSGLAGRRYVRLVNKNQSADAFVSFVGAPRLSASELGELKKVPRLIAECRAADKLGKSFEQKLVDVAVVSRFEFPSPVQGTPRNAQEWFDQRWQIVTTNNASTLPKGDAE